MEKKRMFITLTKRNKTRLRVNKDLISAYFAEDKYTILFLASGSSLQVQETPEQIDQLITGWYFLPSREPFKPTL
jgi:hypothetical protein